MRTIWTNVYFGNTVQDWVTAAAILVVSLLAIYIFKGVVMSRLKRWAERTTTGFDDFVLTLVERSVVPLAYLAAVYFSLDMLEISKTVNKLIHVAYLFAITFFVIRIVIFLSL